MDKETLISKITAKIGNTSLSQRSIADYCQNILPMITDDNQVDEKFLETHGNILKSIEGQLRHDISDGIENFKKDYKPSTPPVTPPAEDETLKALLAEMKTMKESYESLKNDLKGQQEKAAKDAVRTSVIAKMRQSIMDATGAEPNRFVFGVTTSAIEIGENPDVDAIAKTLIAKYDANLKDAGIDTAAPFTGGGGGGGDDFKDFFDKKALEGKFPGAEK